MASTDTQVAAWRDRLYPLHEDSQEAWAQEGDGSPCPQGPSPLNQSVGSAELSLLQSRLGTHRPLAPPPCAPEADGWSRAPQCRWWYGAWPPPLGCATWLCPPLRCGWFGNASPRSGAPNYWTAETCKQPLTETVLRGERGQQPLPLGFPCG